MTFDLQFYLATAAFGWGLSLATYRIVARQSGWPMGSLQANKPVVPVLIGLFALVVAFLFAAARGSQFGGWAILGLGALFALFWTGFLRVASQTSLFLAPIAAILLLVGWVSALLPGSVDFLPSADVRIEDRTVGVRKNPQ